MGLDIPDLHDRTFDELMADLRKEIPIRDDQWTDHNASDPGITILEVLAWLAESYLYQLNRVTDEHVRKYLQLLDVAPESATPASTAITLPSDSSLDGWPLPADTPLCARDRRGEEHAFRTAEQRRLTSATVEQVVSDHQAGRVDNSTANETAGMSFLAFGPAAESGSALYVGFDGEPFAASTLDLTVAFDESLPAPAAHGDEPVDFEPSVAVRWEHCTNYETWYDPDAWAPVEVLRDDTDAFYRSGVVTLRRPDTWLEEPGSILGRDGEYRWLRCRIRHPEPGDAGHEIPPRLGHLRTNVVPVRHGRRIASERLTTARGRAETTDLPGQTFQIPHTPVQSAVVTVGGDEWAEVPDFDASDPDDTHYVLDRDRGRVLFGDGRQGTVPAAGQAVVAGPLVHGGGLRGNLPTSTTWRFEPDTTLGVGVYRYYCAAHRDGGMKGAVIVGDADVTPPVEAWLKAIPNYTAIEDKRGQSDVTVDVGVDISGEPVGFAPPAIRIGPGTEVTFRWVSDGHTVDIEDQPAEGEWDGVPSSQPTGFEHERSFETVALDDVALPTSGTSGGRESESVEATLNRANREQKRTYRAVTAEDFEYLAKHTPGLRFGRSAARVERESVGGSPAAAAAPSDCADEGPPDESATGGCADHCPVTVYVVPYSPHPEPVPSNGFLEAVQCHLERHRLLTDRVTVEPPTYVDVAVSADVVLERGMDRQTRVTACEEAIDTFLDPLAGFDGTGWPFGRTLHRSELYEVLEGVAGVDCVTELSIVAGAGGTPQANGDVTIGPASLFSPGDHGITVETDRDLCEGGSS